MVGAFRPLTCRLKRPATHRHPNTQGNRKNSNGGLLSKLSMVGVGCAAATTSCLLPPKRDLDCTSSLIPPKGERDTRKLYWSTSEESMEERFEAWMQRYKKQYKDDVEKEKHFEVFKCNAEKVDKWNKETAKRYGPNVCTFRDNEYADLPHRRCAGCKVD